MKIGRMLLNGGVAAAVAMGIAGYGSAFAYPAFAQTGGGEIIQFADIFFAAGSAEVPEANTGYLLDVVRGNLAYYKQPDAKVLLKGHAEATLSDEDAMMLSQKRAEAVRSALVARGIPANQVVIVALGKTEPARDRKGNLFPTQAQNQRVQIQFDLR